MEVHVGGPYCLSFFRLGHILTIVMMLIFHHWLLWIIPEWLTACKKKKKHSLLQKHLAAENEALLHLPHFWKGGKNNTSEPSAVWGSRHKPGERDHWSLWRHRGRKWLIFYFLVSLFLIQTSGGCKMKKFTEHESLKKALLRRSLHGIGPLLADCSS